jgi:hypothetical protein
VEKDCWWALVRDHETRTRPAGRWAKWHLGLVEERDDRPPAGRPGIDGHICGWMELDGVWQCVQDFRAIGWAPETSCGSVWPDDKDVDLIRTR